MQFVAISPSPSNMSKSAALTKLAAEIKLAVFDFDGVFTDNTVWTFSDGKEAIRSWRSDGLGIARLKDAGIAVWVLSTELNPIVKVRCQKLAINCLTGLADKKKALERLTKKLSVDFERVMYVGNDINDLECMRLVGLPVAVTDAYGEVKKIAKYVTKRPGGMGAVREICDWIVASKKGGVL